MMGVDEVKACQQFALLAGRRMEELSRAEHWPKSGGKGSANERGQGEAGEAGHVSSRERHCNTADEPCATRPDHSLAPSRVTMNFQKPSQQVCIASHV